MISNGVVGVGSSTPAKPEQEITVEITKNGTQEITPDKGNTLSKVIVDVKVAAEDTAIYHLDESKLASTLITYTTNNGYIGKNQFTYYPNLESVLVRNDLFEVGDDAFYNLSKFNSINFNSYSSAAMTIGKRAFYNTGIQTFDFGNKPVSLGDQSFYGCNLNTITFGGSQIQHANNVHKIVTRQHIKLLIGCEVEAVHIRIIPSVCIFGLRATEIKMVFFFRCQNIHQITRHLRTHHAINLVNVKIGSFP